MKLQIFEISNYYKVQAKRYLINSSLEKHCATYRGNYKQADLINKFYLANKDSIDKKEREITIKSLNSGTAKGCTDTDKSKLQTFMASMTTDNELLKAIHSDKSFFSWRASVFGASHIKEKSWTKKRYQLDIKSVPIINWNQLKSLNLNESNPPIKANDNVIKTNRNETIHKMAQIINKVAKEENPKEVKQDLIEAAIHIFDFMLGE